MYKILNKRKCDIIFKFHMLLIGILSACLFGISQQILWKILAVDFLFLLFFLLSSKKIVVDLSGLALLAGMYIHSKSYDDVSLRPAVALIPFFLYCITKSLMILNTNMRLIEKTRQLVLALTIGMFINSLLNDMEYFIWGFSNGRRWTEFWSKWDIPATQQVFWQLLIVGLTFYFMYYLKTHTILYSILLIGSLFSIWFSLITKSRMLIVIFGIVLIVNILLFFYLNWKKDYIRHIFKLLLLTIAIVAVVFLCLWITNFNDCRNLFENSIWSRDGGILHNIRFQAQLDAIRQLLKYPSGGRQMELASGLYFVHNVWLDMANASGIFSFFLICVYTIFTFINMFKLIIHKRINPESKYLLVSAYFSLWLYYMVETALDAHLMLWAIWMPICGIVSGYLNIQKMKDK